jgi:hypothetical protein
MILATPYQIALAICRATGFEEEECPCCGQVGFHKMSCDSKGEA